MANSAEWDEGREAFIKNRQSHISDCPYPPEGDWDKWADWVCGHGEAETEILEAETSSRPVRMTTR
jgi:hypothetical protein